MKTILSSCSRKVVIGRGYPVTIIGERINPTGKKKMAEALLAKDFNYIMNEAEIQIACGCDMLDVNVGVAGVNEVDLLPHLIHELMKRFDYPLCLDTTNLEAMEASLAEYKGKALINSVTGEKDSMEKVFPLVKKYNCAVIALCLDENGIPEQVLERVAIALRIIKLSEDFGIQKENIIVDCLATSIGVAPKAGTVTLETMKVLNNRMEINLVLGGSNISYGMPDRMTINNAFYAMSILSGATALIMDPTNKQAQGAIKASDALLNNKDAVMNYIRHYKQYK